MAATSLLLFTLMSSSLVAVSDGCTSKTDCQLSQVCCNNYCIYATTCVGRSLNFSRLSLSYTTPSVGRSCTYNSDCNTGESCCSDKCMYGSNCIGYSCTTNSDCGNWETCCYGACQNNYDDCYQTQYEDDTGIIVGAIFGVLLGIFLIALGIFFACRRRRARHGRVIVGGRVTATATTTTTRTTTQTNPLYPGQEPQSYQQSYPHEPPPQYEQQQTAIPPPYTLAGRATPPPPYTGAPQGRSGGVYAPKPAYGAVPV